MVNFLPTHTTSSNSMASSVLLGATRVCNVCVHVCMCVCVCVCACVHVYAYIHTYVPWLGIAGGSPGQYNMTASQFPALSLGGRSAKTTCTHSSSHMYVRTYVRTYVHIQSCMHVYLCTYMHTYTYMHVHMHTHMQYSQHCTL